MIKRHRHLLTAILALCAIGTEVFYSICGGSCQYLRGDLFGIGLQYIGIVFMAIVILLSVFKKDLLLLVMLSAGIGVEIYLVGFQIWHDVYCLYCLIFGGILVAQFILNLRKHEWRLSMAVAMASLILFAIFFKGSVTPAYGGDLPVPNFGNGPVQVRLYADYFCDSCRDLEPQIEPIVRELVNKNIITLTFIDTPMHPNTTLYARFFLYVLNEKKDLELTFRARNVLNEAAEKNITAQGKLETHLNASGIKFKPFDIKPVFDRLNIFLRSDDIRETPTCVIETKGKTETLTESADIVSALKKLIK